MGMNVFQRARQRISEIIGQSTSQFYNVWSNRWRITPTIDITSADAAFWDKARRGRAQGLTLAGLLIKPIGSKIAAWSLGELPDTTLEDEYTQSTYADWFSANHPDILWAYEESLNLGKIYLLINPDLSLSVLPPDTVTPLVDPNDYSRRIGYRVVSVYPHPEHAGDYTRVEEEYYADRRIVTKTTGRVTETKTYRNLLGRVPIVHIANNKGVNETEGRPEVEALLNALQQYDDVLHYALSGNKRQGRPTPVLRLSSPEAARAFSDQNSRTKTKTNVDGTTEQYSEYNIDLDEMLIFGGEQSEFKYVAPGSFMSDVNSLTQLLYYLFIEHTELPEFLLGSAIQGSRASADTQMPPFVKFVEKKQGLCKKWLIELTEIVVGLMSLFDVKIKQGKATINFAPLTGKDGSLTLQAVQFGLTNGLIDRETALRLLPLDIDDPLAVLEAADKEAAQARDAFDARVDTAIQRAEERLAQQDSAAEEDGAVEDITDELFRRALRVKSEAA
jgi:hypothetical protein